MVFAIIGAMRCLSVVLHNTNILNLSLRLKARDFPPDRDIKGSHHIFFKSGIEEIINIQPDNGKAKAYQVKQIRELIVKYKLAEI